MASGQWPLGPLEGDTLPYPELKRFLGENRKSPKLVTTGSRSVLLVKPNILIEMLLACSHAGRSER